MINMINDMFVITLTGYFLAGWRWGNRYQQNYYSFYFLLIPVSRVIIQSARIAGRWSKCCPSSYAMIISRKLPRHCHRRFEDQRSQLHA